MSCGIYEIKNLKNNKVYIGQSVNIERRWNKHKSVAFNTKAKEYNRPLYRSIRKYGVANFDFTVLELCLREDLCEKELYYIKKYNSTDNQYGYNLSIGSLTPVRLSPEKIVLIQERLVHSKDSQEEIAKDFNVDQSMISLINTGSAWLNDDLTYPLRQKGRFCKCGKTISKGNKTGLCPECAREKSRKVERPNRESLKQLIRTLPFTTIGSNYNVTDNAVRKWCKNYNLPSTKREINSISNKDWEVL